MFNGENDNNVKVSLETLKKFVYNNNIRLIKSPVRLSLYWSWENKKKESVTMRRKIQKYLSGEREGFSLIELIIVIAIMAILIGVVALVVLPYLESSRESTDRAALNEVATAFKSAASVNSKYATEVNEITASDSLNADLKKKIESYLEKSLAETEKGLSSKNCTGKKFYFQKSDKGFKVYIGDASGAAKDSDEVEFSTTPASN